MNALREFIGSMGKMGKKEPPASYVAAGKKVVCAHCGSVTFSSLRVLVRGPLSHCLVCTKCGLAIWFEIAPVVAQSGPKAG